MVWTKILDEFRGVDTVVILEQMKISEEWAKDYRVKTMRRYKTLDAAQAAFEAEKGKRKRRGNVPREDRKNPKQ